MFSYRYQLMNVIYSPHSFIKNDILKENWKFSISHPRSKVNISLTLKVNPVDKPKKLSTFLKRMNINLTFIIMKAIFFILYTQEERLLFVITLMQIMANFIF